VSHDLRPSRAPQREIRVTCHGPSRLAVGRRPSVPGGAQALPVPMVMVEAEAWSRGLWGTFLPERRTQGAPRPEGPERRRDAA